VGGKCRPAQGTARPKPLKGDREEGQGQGHMLGVLHQGGSFGAGLGQGTC